jgi:hypothetical protein
MKRATRGHGDAQTRGRGDTWIRADGDAELHTMDQVLGISRPFPFALRPRVPVSARPRVPASARRRLFPIHHLPFTIHHLPFTVHAPVAQLDRAFDFESKGRRFEPCRVHHLDQ